MSCELMSTKEVAPYLEIHEKQVYLPIKTRKIPCTRVTGKRIFSKRLIDEWIQASSQDGLPQAGKKTNQIEGAIPAAVAKILDLNFQPFISERFDMIFDKNTYFQPIVQTFLETLQSDRFKNRVGKIGNYDFKDAGRILYS